MATVSRRDLFNPSRLSERVNQNKVDNLDIDFAFGDHVVSQGIVDKLEGAQLLTGELRIDDLMNSFSNQPPYIPPDFIASVLNPGIGTSEEKIKFQRQALVDILMKGEIAIATVDGNIPYELFKLKNPSVISLFVLFTLGITGIREAVEMKRDVQQKGKLSRRSLLAAGFVFISIVGLANQKILPINQGRIKILEGVNDLQIKFEEGLDQLGIDKNIDFTTLTEAMVNMRNKIMALNTQYIADHYSFGDEDTPQKAVFYAGNAHGRIEDLINGDVDSLISSLRQDIASYLNFNLNKLTENPEALEDDITIIAALSSSASFFSKPMVTGGKAVAKSSKLEIPSAHDLLISEIEEMVKILQEQKQQANAYKITLLKKLRLGLMERELINSSNLRMMTLKKQNRPYESSRLSSEETSEVVASFKSSTGFDDPEIGSKAVNTRLVIGYSVFRNEDCPVFRQLTLSEDKNSIQTIDYLLDIKCKGFEIANNNYVKVDDSQTLKNILRSRNLSSFTELQFATPNSDDGQLLFHKTSESEFDDSFNYYVLADSTNSDSLIAMNIIAVKKSS